MLWERDFMKDSYLSDHHMLERDFMRSSHKELFFFYLKHRQNQGVRERVIDRQSCKLNYSIILQLLSISFY